jgi:hypothetical protein
MLSQLRRQSKATQRCSKSLSTRAETYEARREAEYAADTLETAMSSFFCFLL